MQGILSNLLLAPPWIIYLTVAVLVFSEDAFFAGFIIPGETAAVLGGVAAATGTVDVRIMYAIVIAAAIIGDSVGYEVGKVFGTRLLATKPLLKHAHRLNDAREMIKTRGGLAVFLGRWTAFFRAVMPALAGLSHMPYTTFLRWNAIGGLAWGATFVTVGHVAGHSYHTLERTIGRSSAAIVAVIVIGFLIVRHFRKEKLEAAEEASES